MPILQGRTRRYRKPVIIKYQILAALVGKDPASVSTVAWTVYQKYANGRPLYWQEKDGKQYGAQTQSFNVLWSSIFVTLMANKIGGLQFGIYRNCQISSRVFHTAVAALPLTKANRSDFE